MSHAFSSESDRGRHAKMTGEREKERERETHTHTHTEGCRLNDLIGLFLNDKTFLILVILLGKTVSVR